jgi:hypothetical protein
MNQAQYSETLEQILRTFREDTALFVLIEALWDDDQEISPYDFTIQCGVSEVLEDWK